MPIPKRSRRARPVLGVAPVKPKHPWKYGATGNSRPAGADTYLINGVVHRYDGKCHPECENVR